MKSRFIALLVWVLIFQVSLSYPLLTLAAQNPVGASEVAVDPSLSGPASAALGEGEEFIQRMSESATPPAPTDNAFLVSQQFRREYQRVRGADGRMHDEVVREIPLNRANLQIEPVAVLNPDREIKFRYNANALELEILHVLRDTRTGEEYVTDSHVIKNLTLTGDTSQINERLNSAAQRDANFVYILTREGVRVLSWEQMLPPGASIDKQILFVAPVVVPLVVAMPPFAGAHLESVEALNPGAEPRVLHRTDGTAAANYQDGDLSLKVSSLATLFRDAAGTSRERHFVISRSEIWMNYRLRMKQLLKAMAAVNAPLESVADIENALRLDEAEDLAAADRLGIEREALLDAGTGVNGLVATTLANLAQRTDFQPLLGQGNPSSAFSQYAQRANAVRTRRDASPGADSQWQRLYQSIIQRQNSHSQLGASITWRQATVEFLTGEGDPVLKKAQEDQQRAEKSLFARMGASFKALATPQRLRTFASVVALGALAYGANRATEGALYGWIAASVTRVLDASLNVPIVNILTRQIHASVGYFRDGWAWARWGVGLAVIMSFYPLSLVPAKIWARLQGQPWNAQQAFFTIFTRIFANANYGIRTLVWRNLLGQKLLYESMDANLSLTRNWRNVFNVPHRDALVSLIRRIPGAAAIMDRYGIRPDQLDRHAQGLSQAVHDQTIRKFRAKLLAAAVVSEMDHVDVATLLIADQLQGQVNLDALVTKMNRDQLAQWGEMTQRVYSALIEINDDGIGQIDQQSVEEYTRVFQNMTAQVKQARESAPRSSLVVRVEGLWQQSQKTMSRSILPWLLYGKGGYDLYRRFRGAVIDSESTKIASEQYGPDYLASAVFYALTDAAKFGDMVSRGLGAVEVTTNQAGQPVTYGAMLGVDVASAALPGSSDEVDSQAPVTDDIFTEASSTMVHREQTLGQGLRVLAQNITDPDSPSVFGTWRQYMTNTINGFEGRWLLGTPIRAAGMIAAAYVAAHSSATSMPGIGSIVGDAALREAFWWFGKYSVLPGVVVGYAIIWPIVTLMSRFLNKHVKNNLEKIRVAARKIMVGVDENSDDTMRVGISEMKGLYQQGNVNLPAALQVEADQYDATLATKLINEARVNPPLATRASETLNKWIMNVGLGSMISTTFFIGLSAQAFNRDTSGVALLLKGLAGLTATWLMTIPAESASKTFWSTMKAIQPVESVRRAARSINNRIRNALGLPVTCENALKSDQSSSDNSSNSTENR